MDFAVLAPQLKLLSGIYGVLNQDTVKAESLPDKTDVFSTAGMIIGYLKDGIAFEDHRSILIFATDGLAKIQSSKGVKRGRLHCYSGYLLPLSKYGTSF